MINIRIVSPRPNNFKEIEEVETCLNEFQACGLYDVGICRPQACSIDELRNNGIKAVYKDGQFFHDENMCSNQSLSHCEYDYLLMHDSDVSFLPEDITKMIDRNVGIVGAAVPFRLNENCFTGGYFSALPAAIDFDRVLSNKSTGIVRVDWVAGLVLIKKCVFQGMAYPWYRAGYRFFNDGDARKAYYSSDDAGFGFNAASHDFPVYCDCDVIVKHHFERA